MSQTTSEIFYDFDLIIRQTSMGLYTVSLVAETGKKAAEEVFQHFDSLREVPEALKKAKSSDPREVPSMYNKLRGFGEKIHESLLSGKIGREVRRFIEVGGSVALRLRIEPVALKAVPWESIFSGEEFLAASSSIVLSRIPPGTAKSDKPVVTGTPNLAFIMLRPFLEEYGDENYWDARKKAVQVPLKEVVQSGRINVSFHEVTTLNEVKDVLEGDNYEIAHIFSESEDNQVIIAEGELISAPALTAVLGAIESIRLVVLSSIRSRNLAVENMGRDLIAAKIPGVLVMPLEMGPAQERAFLGAFYHAVAQGKRLDYATSLARRAAMEEEKDRSDFLLPMFFMSMSQPFNPAPVEKPQPPEEPPDEYPEEPREKSPVIGRLRALVEKEKGGQKAMALASLAHIQQQKGEDELAIENYDLAIPLFEEAQDKYNLAVALNNTATIFMRRREYAKAVEPLDRCVELRRELGSKEETAIALNKLGYSYHKIGKLKESVENYREALDLNLQRHDVQGLCDSYFSLGIAYEKMGDLKAAADMLKKSIETARDMRDDARITDALEYLGTIYFDAEDYTHAKDAYHQSRELREKIKDKSGLGTTLTNLGNVEQRMDNLDEARKYYEEAILIHTGSEKKVGIASCLHNLANVHYKQGRTLEAISSALKARSIAVESKIELIDHMSSALLEKIKVEVGRDRYAGLLSRAQEQMDT